MISYLRLSLKALCLFLSEFVLGLQLNNFRHKSHFSKSLEKDSDYKILNIFTSTRCFLMWLGGIPYMGHRDQDGKKVDEMSKIDIIFCLSILS